MHNVMSHKYMVRVFVLLVILHVLLSYRIPVAKETVERFELDHTEALWLRTAVLIPTLIIWTIALYGFLHILRYGSTIKESPESKPISMLGTGLMLLAFGFPIASIAGNVATIFITENPNFEPAVTIIRNYIQILFPLLAFIYLKYGASGLVKTVRTKANKVQENLLIVGYTLLASGYTVLMFSTPFSDTHIEQIYFLPMWLIVVTVITPYLFTWYNGIVAAYQIIRYKNQVKGVVYKNVFSRFASGLIVITITAVLIRVLITLIEQITELNLSPLLALVYILLIFYGIGYGLVASGSRQLTKIEKI